MKHKKLATVFGIVVAGLTPLGLLGCGRAVKQQGTAALNRADYSLQPASTVLSPALDSLTPALPAPQPFNHASRRWNPFAPPNATTVLAPGLTPNNFASALARYLAQHTKSSSDRNFGLAPFNKMSRKPGVAFPGHFPNSYTREIVQASEVVNSPVLVQKYLTRQKYVFDVTFPPQPTVTVTVGGQPVIKSVRASDTQGTITFNLDLTCPQVGMVVPVVVPNLAGTGWLKTLALTPANLSKEVWYDYESPGYWVIHVDEGVTSLQPNLGPGDHFSLKGVPYKVEAIRLILPTTIRHVARGVFGSAAKPVMPDYLRFRGPAPLYPLNNPKLTSFAPNAFVGSNGIAISYVDSGLPAPATTNWQQYITVYFKNAFA